MHIVVKVILQFLSAQLMNVTIQQQNMEFLNS